MRPILAVERVATRVALVLAILFLSAAAALALYQVFTRFVLASPSTWSEAFVRSTMIWAVFLGVAPAIRDGTMIAIEVVQDALPRRLGLGLHVTVCLLSVFFFAVLFWQGWGMTERVLGQTLAGLRISIAWAYAALPVGAAFAIVALVGAMLRAIAEGARPGAAPETAQ
ncbi:MAG: TRAP transporter small permease [Paracoccaceae bacterium]